jgi:tetratricopeptide (TPR) repeat protein
MIAKVYFSLRDICRPMQKNDYATRVWLLASISLVLSVGVIIWQAPILGVSTAFWWGFLLFVSLYWLTIIPVFRAGRRFVHSCQTEDTATARKELAEITRVSLLVPNIHRVLPQWETSILLIEERYQEALPKIEALNRRLTKGRMKLHKMNNLAWCLAHTGDSARAIEIAQSVLREAEHQPSNNFFPYALGTLGTAYYFANQPARAHEFLQRSLAVGENNPRSQAARAYYLGESFRAMGKTEAARQAYQRAIQELPGSRYAVHAEERLRLL